MGPCEDHGARWNRGGKEVRTGMRAFRGTSIYTTNIRTVVTNVHLSAADASHFDAQTDAENATPAEQNATSQVTSLADMMANKATAAPREMVQEEPTQVAEARTSSATSANVFANGNNQNCGNFITDRSTTRVRAPPGGHSSITFA